MKKTAKTAKTSGTDKFPGYPQYPSSEDIMTREKRVSLDADGTAIPNLPADAETTKKKFSKGKPSETDVTKSDLRALRSEENTYKGDDAELENRVYPVDFAGKDLDVPGTELDEDGELRGSEDEENNNYSIGGDRHDDLEEDKSAV